MASSRLSRAIAELTEVARDISFKSRIQTGPLPSKSGSRAKKRPMAKLFKVVRRARRIDQLEANWIKVAAMKIANGMSKAISSLSNTGRSKERRLSSGNSRTNREKELVTTTKLIK